MSMLTCMSIHNYVETGDKYSLQGGWIEKNNALSTFKQPKENQLENLWKK